MPPGSAAVRSAPNPRSDPFTVTPVAARTHPHAQRRPQAQRAAAGSLDVGQLVLLASAIIATAYFIFHIVTLIQLNREIGASMAGMDEFTRALVGSLAGAVISAVLPTSFYIFFGLGVAFVWAAVFIRRWFMPLIAVAAYLVALIIQPRLWPYMGAFALLSGAGCFFFAPSCLPVYYTADTQLVHRAHHDCSPRHWACRCVHRGAACSNTRSNTAVACRTDIIPIRAAAHPG